MRTSYNREDVELLLKDLTGAVEPVTLEERDRRVANGEYVRSILIKEYEVSEEYRGIVNKYIPVYADKMGELVAKLADKLYEAKGDNIVLVDIVRAGIPIGILLKRYLKFKYNIDVMHYGISLVKGLDKEAMSYIVDKHGAENVQFVDGWTGKGTVAKEIKASCDELKTLDDKYKELDDSLAVLSDAIGVAKYAGTREDVYIPNSPLNASITGLVSITILNEKYKQADDFHGAAYLSELEEIDQSKEFVDLVTDTFKKDVEKESDVCEADDTEIDKLASELGRDKKLLNPGINEAARAVLRRKLEKLIVLSKEDEDCKALIELAECKGIKIEERPLKGYKALSVADDNYIR